MKINTLIYGVVFLVGSIFNQVLFHIRFNNDLLRREMLILMREDNSGYFLSFIILDVFLIFFLCLWIFIIYRRNKIKGNKVIVSKSNRYQLNDDNLREAGMT
jgi:cbb3-type cytochrome oxidase subunit 3